MAMGRQLLGCCGDYERIFEWADGALVEAMRCGGAFLVDEISLAEAGRRCFSRAPFFVLLVLFPFIYSFLFLFFSVLSFLFLSFLCFLFFSVFSRGPVLAPSWAWGVKGERKQKRTFTYCFEGGGAGRAKTRSVEDVLLAVQPANRRFLRFLAVLFGLVVGCPNLCH